MINLLKRILGIESPPDRRKYERYVVDAPLKVTVDGKEYECSIDNVSAGGVKLAPVLGLDAGIKIEITHQKSGLSLPARVVADDPDGTRVQFDSEEAGTIVSVWVRMLHEDA